MAVSEKPVGKATETTSPREELLRRLRKAYKARMAREDLSQTELARKILVNAQLPLTSLGNLAALGGSSQCQLPNPHRFTVLTDSLFPSATERAGLQRLYWQAVDALPPGNRVEMGIDAKRPATICENCGRECAPRPRRRFCSRLCKAEATRKPVENDTTLVRFLVEQERSSKLSRSAFALAIGLDPHCYYTLLRVPGQLPTQATLDVLLRAFGDRLPATPTETARRQRRALENLLLYAPLPGTEAAKLQSQRAVAISAARNRGRAMAPATKAKIGVKRRQTLLLPDHLADRNRLGDYMRTPEGRALGSLRRFLEWSAPGERHRAGPRSIPKSLHEGPSRAEWRARAGRVAEGVGLDQAAVLQLWVPRLQELGLWSTRGRKPLLQRYAVVVDLRAAWPTGKRGFWKAALDRVIAELGREGSPAGPRELRIWFTRFERQHGQGIQNSSTSRSGRAH